MRVLLQNATFITNCDSTLYEKERFVKLCLRDSRSIKAAEGRVKYYLSDDMRYHELTYLCVHGGKQFKPRGNDERETL